MELNKIAAAVLLAGLIAMVTGKVSTLLYSGGAQHEAGHEVARGYTIAGAEAFAAGATGATAAAPKELASIAPLMAAADAAAGEAYFKKKCSLCHNADKGGANATGPALWGVLGRDKGSAAGFAYSKGLAAAEGNWDYDALNRFINKPQKAVAGTIMAFAGEANDQNRANLIAYLRAQHDAPPALPEVKAEPAAEAPAEAAPAKAKE